MDQNDLIAKNLQPLRIDAMPAEVATAYLTTPGTKITGSFRRVCQRARSSYYVSSNAPKQVADKLAGKFSRWSIDRLHRQRRRTEQRIKIVQGKLNRITVSDIHTQIVNTIMLPLLAVGNALTAEINRRTIKD